ASSAWAAAARPRRSSGGSAARPRAEGAVRIRSFEWATGLFCLLLGALILVAPHVFYPPAFAPLVAYRSWIASWLALGGCALLGAAVLDPRRGLVWAAHL